MRLLTRFASFLTAMLLVGCASTEPTLSEAHSAVDQAFPFKLGRVRWLLVGMFVTTSASAEQYDFEFGLAVEDVSRLLGQDTTGFEGFASWFVKPNVRLSAHYRVDDAELFGSVFIGGGSTVSDADQDRFGISATVRF